MWQQDSRYDCTDFVDLAHEIADNALDRLTQIPKATDPLDRRNLPHGSRSPSRTRVHLTATTKLPRILSLTEAKSGFGARTAWHMPTYC